MGRRHRAAAEAAAARAAAEPAAAGAATAADREQAAFRCSSSVRQRSATA